MQLFKMVILRHATELGNLTKKLPVQKLLFDLLIVSIIRKYQLKEESLLISTVK